MGCVQSKDLDAGKARSDKIDKQLRKDRLNAKNEIKVLLVGARDSGKSEIVKKMKLIHGGFTDSDREACKEIVYSNTIQSTRAILYATTQLDLVLAQQNEIHRAVVLSLPAGIEPENLRDVATAVRSLWQDPAVLEAVRRSPRSELSKSAAYYSNAIDRLASPSYLPTDQDILLREQKARGIMVTTFKVDKLTYNLLDGDRQRGDRRKWIHCFDNVMALVFVVSLKEYDQVLYEDETVNCMEDALTLFGSLCHSCPFSKTSVILFLNDADLFAEKLLRSPLEKYFPDYKGGGDYDAACDYLKQRFVRLGQNLNRQIYVHYTSPSDTQLFSFLLNAIQDIKLRLWLWKRREPGDS